MKQKPGHPECPVRAEDKCPHPCCGMYNLQGLTGVGCGGAHPVCKRLLSLGYILNSRPAWATGNTVSKTLTHLYSPGRGPTSMHSIHTATHIYGSNSRGSNVLFWPPRTPGVQVASRAASRFLHTHPWALTPPQCHHHAPYTTPSTS